MRHSRISAGLLALCVSASSLTVHAGHDASTAHPHETSQVGSRTGQVVRFAGLAAGTGLVARTVRRVTRPRRSLQSARRWATGLGVSGGAAALGVLGQHLDGMPLNQLVEPSTMIGWGATGAVVSVAGLAVNRMRNALGNAAERASVPGRVGRAWNARSKGAALSKRAEESASETEAGQENKAPRARVGIVRRVSHTVTAVGAVAGGVLLGTAVAPVAGAVLLGASAVGLGASLGVGGYRHDKFQGGWTASKAYLTATWWTAFGAAWGGLSGLAGFGLTQQHPAALALGTAGAVASGTAAVLADRYYAKFPRVAATAE